VNDRHSANSVQAKSPHGTAHGYLSSELGYRLADISSIQYARPSRMVNAGFRYCQIWAVKQSACIAFAFQAQTQKYNTQRTVIVQINVVMQGLEPKGMMGL
jgi:hypothetical protein